MTFARRSGARFNRGRLASKRSGLANFGEFARLVTSVQCLQAVQSDAGLTLGGTLLASGTTPPVITITGSAASAIGIRIECTLLGILTIWTGRVSYDNGATYPQAFTSAATVPLTGAGTGITLNIAAGAAATDNVWNSTCSALADQNGTALHYSQGTAANQPMVIGSGLNSLPTLLFDGGNDSLASSLVLPAPGTTPTFIWSVFRSVTWTANDTLFSNSGAETNCRVLQRTASPQIAHMSPTAVNNNSGAAVNSWVRLEAWFNNATSDYLKLAATSVTGANAGNTAGVTGRTIGVINSTAFANHEIAAVLYFSGKPSAAELAALDAAVTAKYGGLVAV